MVTARTHLKCLHCLFQNDLCLPPRMKGRQTTPKASGTGTYKGRQSRLSLSFKLFICFSLKPQLRRKETQGVHFITGESEFSVAGRCIVFHPSLEVRGGFIALRTRLSTFHFPSLDRQAASPKLATASSDWQDTVPMSCSARPKVCTTFQTRSCRDSPEICTCFSISLTLAALLRKHCFLKQAFTPAPKVEPLQSKMKPPSRCWKSWSSRPPKVFQLAVGKGSVICIICIIRLSSVFRSCFVLHDRPMSLHVLFLVHSRCPESCPLLDPSGLNKALTRLKAVVQRKNLIVMQDDGTWSTWSSKTS